MTLNRRDFLRLFSTSIAIAPIACSSTPDETPGGTTSTPDISNKYFPQGVASGDPKPAQVLLWTRVEPTALGKAATDTIEVQYVIALNESLSEIVASGTFSAKPEADHTVRVIATALTPATKYFYRFSVGEFTTQVGRTKSAPAADSDTPVNFAFASCQDFGGRYYHAWKALLDEKADLDFVLFLGDYIYETVDDERFQDVDPARVVKLVDGKDISDKQDKSKNAASTVADYRMLYKTYRTDEHLREVHRLYPFISIWDDHEFANDCWGDHTTDFGELDPKTKGFTDEKDTSRRNAASQAWAEYQLADITFDAAKTFPENIAIYRSFNYGKHVDIVCTDQRMFRDDHVITEGGPNEAEVGKIFQNSEVGTRLFVKKDGFDPREAAKKPTMLGAKQKQWFIDQMKGSKATWKLWANEVQLWEGVLDLTPFTQLVDSLRAKFYLTCDQWDGYRSERAEILKALSGVTNLVACTGDIHSFNASELHVDFGAPTAKPVGVEYVTAGISSSSIYSILERTVAASPVLTGLKLPELIPQIDEVLKKGAPYLKHADSKGNGVSLMSVTAAQIDVTFIKTGDPTKKADTGVKSRVKFRTMAGSNTITTV
ncbi:MAG: alkaline phosphatase D family protein [Polyangiaceae bacterium]|nr:alkaline phosphatase D family protein [Polyangiaceae bacterium]